MASNAMEAVAVQPPHVPLSQGLLVLGAVVVLIAVYIALCVGLSVADLFPGYFFLYHWGSIEHARMTALAKVIPSAIAGLVLGWLPIWPRGR
jgi:hypothetical protein